MLCNNIDRILHIQLFRVNVLNNCSNVMLNVVNEYLM